MVEARKPVIVGIVGKKNSGKTTLLVGVAAELGRRGFRVASVKHGHHDAEIDQPGSDSWRHVHEGGVEGVLLLTGRRVSMVLHTPEEEPDLRASIQRHFGARDFDIVLVEGFKHGDLLKIEVHRRGVHQRPVYDPADSEAAARFLAMVTDDPDVVTGCRVILLEEDLVHGPHVGRVADLIADLVRAERTHA